MIVPILAVVALGHMCSGQALVNLDVFLGIGGGGGGGKGGCANVQSIDRSLRDAYCDQPQFVTFAPKTEEVTLIDNICYTLFPLPDDPNTYQLYISRVYCDGSTDINSYIVTDIELGVFRAASPYCTFTDTVFGYAGCDTYLMYRCYLYGDCEQYDEGVANVFGLSPLCRPMGLSCLRKVEEIVRDNCLPEQDYYALPMKLPNKCVTSQICVNTPPAVEFGRAVGVEVARPAFRGFI